MSWKSGFLAFCFVAVCLAQAGCASLSLTSDHLTTAYKEAPNGTLGLVGLYRQPTTVFVPDRYRYGRDGALYIHGDRFVAPGGYADVRGFLPAKNGDGYIVAVKQDSMKRDAGAYRQPPYLVYYRVSPVGRVIDRLGVIAGVSNVLVGVNAIYGVTRGVSGLVSLSGYTRSGASIAGPQGVLSASPAPDGGWFIVRFSGDGHANEPTKYQVRLIEKGPDGRVESSVALLRDTRGWVTMINRTSAIFVNRPPYAATVRSGQWLQLRLLYDPYTNGKDSQYVLYVLDLQGSSIAIHALAWLGSHRFVTRREAYSLARRTIVLADRFGLQLDLEGQGALTWGLVSAESDWGNADIPPWRIQPLRNFANEKGMPVFSIYSGVGNLFRRFSQNNGATMTLNSRNGVYLVLTPRATLLVAANDEIRHQYKALGIIAQDRRVAILSGVMRQFLVRYGVML